MLQITIMYSHSLNFCSFLISALLLHLIYLSVLPHISQQKIPPPFYTVVSVLLGMLFLYSILAFDVAKIKKKLIIQFHNLIFYTFAHSNFIRFLSFFNLCLFILFRLITIIRSACFGIAKSVVVGNSNPSV
jgi:hypothetical protein